MVAVVAIGACVVIFVDICDDRLLFVVVVGRVVVLVVGVIGEVVKKVLTIKFGIEIFFGEVECGLCSEDSAVHAFVYMFEGLLVGGFVKFDVVVVGSVFMFMVGGKVVVSGGSAIVAVCVAVIAARLYCAYFEYLLA